MTENQSVSVQNLVRLVPVDKDNFRECVKLPTGEDHRHVAPNVYSIAQAQYIPGSKSCCIYHSDEMVGYTLYELSQEDGRLKLWVSRLMMAEPQRGKGYGRATLQLLIAEARQQGCVEVGLSTHPDNFKAIGLYENLGFHATEMDDGEMVYVCPLQAE
jgi:diamine N-acetyltransferase